MFWTSKINGGNRQSKNLRQILTFAGLNSYHRIASRACCKVIRRSVEKRIFEYLFIECFTDLGKLNLLMLDRF